MGHCDHDPGERIQIVFQNGQRWYVNIIRNLVQKQHVWSGSQHFQKIETLLLPARQLFNGRILHRGVKKELFQKLRRADRPVFCGDILRHVFNIIDDPAAGVHLFYFLGKIANLYRFSNLHTPFIRLCLPGDNL